jgi:hypothetical protein
VNVDVDSIAGGQARLYYCAGSNDRDPCNQPKVENAMNKKSRMFLGMACAAMGVALITHFVPALASTGVRDFAIGLGAALLVGTLVTWKRYGSPHA